MNNVQHPPIYLDYNATAPLMPEAKEAILQAWAEYPGNPSSPHAFGQSARDALEEYRTSLAGWVGFHRREFLITAGGTESNNTILRQAGLTGAGGHIITSPIEHPSVLESCAWLSRRGVAVDYLPVSGEGVVDVGAVGALIRPDTRLVSLMAANNETGVIQPVAELVKAVREAQGDRTIPVHCDAVQAFGRIALPADAWGVDALTLAAHKLGGPKGIGALAVREGIPLEGLLLGGAQERGRRAGTESVALAAGFQEAAHRRIEKLELDTERVRTLRDRMAGALSDLPGYFLNGAKAFRLPNTLNLGFTGISAQSLLVSLDLKGVAVSTGSACSSGAMEPSHVLRAMGLPDELLHAALRISLGPESTLEEVDRAIDIFRIEVLRLSGRKRAAS